MAHRTPLEAALPLLEPPPPVQQPEALEAVQSTQSLSLPLQQPVALDPLLGRPKTQGRGNTQPTPLLPAGTQVADLSLEDFVGVIRSVIHSKRETPPSSSSTSHRASNYTSVGGSLLSQLAPLPGSGHTVSGPQPTTGLAGHATSADWGSQHWTSLFISTLTRH